MRRIKKVLAVVMTLIMCFSLAACGKKKETSDKKTDTTEAVVEESTEAAESKNDGNLIVDGAFDNGINHWGMYTNGGSANAIYKEKQLVVSTSKTGSVEHGVQVYYDGFGLDTGCVYHLSFDIAATVERSAEWRIQMNGGDYHAYVSDAVSLTTEMQHVDTSFTMEEGSDPAPRLCFNLGKFEADAELGDHEIMIDNVTLTVEDESNKVQAEAGPERPNINVNQVGYLTNATKKAILRGEDVDSKFSVVNADSGETVYEGEVTDIDVNKSTAEKSGVADFSEVTAAGTYKVVSEKNGESDSFVIGDDVYNDLLKDAIKMLYLQRCGVELTEECAGDFKHPVCHDSEATIYGTSDKIEVSGGWHDAGDYGRYTVSGAKAVADILLAYENNPAAFDDAVGIPESGNGVADILDEARFELEWLLKMQDDKGGVYHKVTTAAFGDAIMPDQEKEELIVMPVSTAATGDFAAVMAMAGRVYKDVDAAFATTCLDAAKKSIDYLQTVEFGAGYKNPEDITTGEYPDKNQKDERLWAYAEYFKTTGDADVHKLLKAEPVNSASCGLGWAAVGYYAVYAYMTSDNKDEALANVMMGRMNDGIVKVVENGVEDIYDCTIGETYWWGSNMNILNNAMLLQMTDTINAEEKYKDLAAEQVHYVLGKNGNSYCFVTGYGTLSPEHTHHRPSQFLGKTMKGMLVGGADSNLEDPYTKATMQETPAALCYVDNEQSYSSNEVTVYWNSPLIYTLSQMMK